MNIKNTEKICEEEIDISGRVAFNHSFIAVAAAASVATVAAPTFLVRRIHQFFSPE